VRAALPGLCGGSLLAEKLLPALHDCTGLEHLTILRKGLKRDSYHAMGDTMAILSETALLLSLEARMIEGLLTSCQLE